MNFLRLAKDSRGSGYTPPPFMAANTIRVAFNELGIQYIEDSNPALRHLDYVILKIGDR